MVRSNGLLLGTLAVCGFSLTIPMTRVAVPYLGPEFVSIGRTVAAGLIALVILGFRRERFPRRSARSLIIASLCGMLAYPLLMALALAHVPAIHGAVIIGFMPALTAACAVWRGGERPSAQFWAACALGAAAVLGFALISGAGHVGAADGLLVVAALVCSYGYAEGALVARSIGGWRVVCWGQALILPVTLPALLFAERHGLPGAGVPLSAWLAFTDLVVVSALVGFLIWYVALAAGGVARVGQTQLLQLPLSILWSVLFLGEKLDTPTLCAATFIVLSAFASFLTRQPPVRFTPSAAAILP